MNGVAATASRSSSPRSSSPRQVVCGGAECQRKRRTDYHRSKIASDPEYREGCRDSPRKWRSRNPDYWKQYRQKHPAAVERNCQQQKLRDRKRRLCNLANNTSDLDLKHSAEQVWLVGGAAPLANNNSTPAQVWVIEALPPHPVPPAPSCKQHPTLTSDQINDLHRLYWSEHWAIRKIERHLNMGWKTIRKYLVAPAQGPVRRDRPSKLDPFKGAITEWLAKDPRVTAAVTEQKRRPLGFRAATVREYVRNARPQVAPKRAFVRMEPRP